MDVILCQPPGGDGAHQVLVTRVLRPFSGHQPVHVRVTARADDVMYGHAVFIKAIGDEGVSGDGGQGTEPGVRGPQTVVGAEVGSVDGAGLPRVQTLLWVVQIP